MGNSPLRLQKCCLRDTRGRRGAARKRGRAGGGWEDCWNLGMGFTRGRGKAGRHGGATRRRGGEWREGGGVVRTLCQELSALGKNSIPPVKGDDALFRRAEYSRGGNFRESLRAAVFPSPP